MKTLEFAHKIYRRSSTGVTNEVTPILGVRADSTRIGLRVVAPSPAGFAVSLTSIRIGVVDGASFTPVMFLNTEHPVDEIHFSEYGTLLFEEFWAITDLGEAQSYSITELLVREMRF